MSAAEVIPGAEPFSAAGGATGVLVLHGFTGNPSSMRDLAEAFADAGYTVELPRLPGHGTTIDDMLTTSFDDWSSAAESAYDDLAGRCERVVVVGMSMGGSLACWLATRHSEIAGLVCINPAVAPSDDMRNAVAALVDAGEVVMPGIGSDIARPGVVESSYADTPLAPLLTLFAAAEVVGSELGRITSPMLLFTSPEDHVVPPADSDILAAAVAGPVERVSCDRSYHVATLDFDADMIIERSVEFVARLGQPAR